MSFFNKLTSKLDELDLGSDKPKTREGYSGEHSYPPPSQQYGGSSYGQQPYPPYDDKPTSSPYPASSPPPNAGPTYSPPPDKPPIPAGWIPQFDQQYQRWYYYEQATGRSQWEAPGYHGASHGEEDRGWGSHGESGYSSQAAPGYGYSSHDSHGYESHGDHGKHGDYGYGHGEHGYGHQSEERYGDDKPKKKKGGHGGLLLGAAGGLAVGAIGGALLANALDDSSDDERHQAPAPVYAAPPPAPVYAEPVYEPEYNAEGEYVDASDRESVRSAREDYEEAVAEAQDSDASSSDFEEVEEAREEYEEEYEEVYD
ncbi:hypothetical protein F5Y06DRAFT_73926 [Hypoxylon sp. FL0890]|nr:hypothetical protein F5Y06DRAFT_73926 [Hypoxylon sp. FL0890]